MTAIPSPVYMVTFKEIAGMNGPLILASCPCGWQSAGPASWVREKGKRHFEANHVLSQMSSGVVGT